MMRRFFYIGFVLMLAFGATHATTGDYFTINYTPNGTLTINTTIPNHLYKNAGIKMDLPFGLLCTPQENGYCLFSVSDTLSASFQIYGPIIASIAHFNLCLNGEGPLSCQNYEANVQLDKLTLSVTGSPLVLTTGGDTGSLTITNTNPVVTAINIQARIDPSSDLYNNVIVSGNTCATLAPYASCTISFTSLANAVTIPPTNVDIQGLNTFPAPASIEIVEPPQTTITATPSSATLTVGSTMNSQITITNNSSTPAYSITVVSNTLGDAANISITTPDTCATLVQGGDPCIFTIEPLAQASGTVTFQGSNTTASNAVDITINAATSATITTSSTCSLSTLTPSCPISITNNGPDNATNITAFLFAAGLSSSVTASYSNCSSVAPSGICTITLTLIITPTVDTTYSLNIYGANTNTVTVPVSINLTGTFSVNPLSLAMAQPNADNQTITVTNTGTEPILNLGVTTTSSYLNINSSCSDTPCGTTLDGNSSCCYNVKLNSNYPPASPTNGTITISASNSDPLSIDVAVTVYPEVTIKNDNSSPYSYIITPTTSSSVSILIKNTDNSNPALPLSAQIPASLSSYLSVSKNGCNTNLAAGAECTIKLTANFDGLVGAVQGNVKIFGGNTNTLSESFLINAVPGYIFVPQGFDDQGGFNNTKMVVCPLKPNGNIDDVSCTKDEGGGIITPTFNFYIPTGGTQVWGYAGLQSGTHESIYQYQVYADGTLGAAYPLNDTDFTEPTSVSFDNDNAYAFVVNGDDNSGYVVVCPVCPDGTFGNGKKTSGGTSGGATCSTGAQCKSYGLNNDTQQNVTVLSYIFNGFLYVTAADDGNYAYCTVSKLENGQNDCKTDNLPFFYGGFGFGYYTNGQKITGGTRIYQDETCIYNVNNNGIIDTSSESNCANGFNFQVSPHSEIASPFIPSVFPKNLYIPNSGGTQPDGSNIWICAFNDNPFGKSSCSQDNDSIWENPSFISIIGTDVLGNLP